MTPKSVSKISFPVNVAVVVRDCVGGSGDGGGGGRGGLKASNSNFARALGGVEEKPLVHYA